MLVLYAFQNPSQTSSGCSHTFVSCHSLSLSHTRLLTFDLLGGLVTLEKLGDGTSTEQNHISLRPGAFCRLFLPSGRDPPQSLCPRQSAARPLPRVSCRTVVPTGWSSPYPLIPVNKFLSCYISNYNPDVIT